MCIKIFFSWFQLFLLTAVMNNCSAVLPIRFCSLCKNEVRSMILNTSAMLDLHCCGAGFGTYQCMEVVLACYRNLHIVHLLFSFWLPFSWILIFKMFVSLFSNVLLLNFFCVFFFFNLFALSWIMCRLSNNFIVLCEDWFTRWCLDLNLFVYKSHRSIPVIFIVCYKSLQCFGFQLGCNVVVIEIHKNYLVCSCRSWSITFKWQNGCLWYSISSWLSFFLFFTALLKEFMNCLYFQILNCYDSLQCDFKDISNGIFDDTLFWY